MHATPSKAQWEASIRALAQDSGRVFFTQHAKLRMRQRGVMRREPEPDLKTGHTLCRMERAIAGRNVGAVVALKNIVAEQGAVVTAMLIGE